MNNEARLILELWESIRDLVPQNKREALAEHFLKRFEEYGVDPGQFEDLRTEDKHLKEAFDVLYSVDPEAEYEDAGDGNDSDDWN